MIFKKEPAMNKIINIITLGGLAIIFLLGNAKGEQWKFGLIADTQWPSATGSDSLSGFKNPNSVAVDIINQVNKEFISKGVKLVVAVGDITDNGSNLALDTRATYVQALYNAGIGFYPLRGNHESSKTAAIEFKRIFPQTQNGLNNSTPSDAFVFTDSAQTKPAAKSGSTFTIGSGFSSPSTPLSGLSYTFTYNNATFVLLDQFTPPDSSANTIDAQQSWISNALASRPSGTHAFVFGHKGLITENHADILFSTDEATGLPTDDSAGVNAFIESLVSMKVHYYMGGHDHIHNRAMVSTTDGITAKVQDIILASDSYKFYKPANPSNDSKYDSVAFGHDRETPIAQDYAQIGYYIVTVDSARVWVDYYGVPSGQTGGVIAVAPTLTGNWVKRETFGYGLNGREFAIPQGQPYTTVIDSNGGTAARILSGINTSTARDSSGRACTQIVGTGWSSSTNTGMASKIISLWGMANGMGSSQTGNYTLSMNYTPPSSSTAIIQGNFGLISKNASDSWTNAVDGNSGGTKNFMLGPWTSSATLGAYGIDTTTHTAWAVINFAGDFAVADFGQVSIVPSLRMYSILKKGAMYMAGNKLMVPFKRAGDSMRIEIFTLSGQMLLRDSPIENFLDVSNLKKVFKNKEVVVKCISGNNQSVQKMLLQ
jgi:Calcineurin-like phosphoesterase.